MELSQLDRLSVLACATGLALVAVFFILDWLGAPAADWLPMVITAIAGFELYMAIDATRRRRAEGRP